MLLSGRGHWAMWKFECSQIQTALEANRWPQDAPSISTLLGARLRRKAVAGRSEAPRPWPIGRSIEDVRGSDNGCADSCGLLQKKSDACGGRHFAACLERPGACAVPRRLRAARPTSRPETCMPSGKADPCLSAGCPPSRPLRVAQASPRPTAHARSHQYPRGLADKRATAHGTSS